MVYEKKCVICGKWFYTADEENEICSETCKRDIRLSKYEKAPKNRNSKRFKSCAWCGTQHYRQSKYCSEYCEQQFEELKERKKLCKKLKCKYIKYLGNRCDTNMICDFKLMAKYAPESEKPCVKYKEGEKNDSKTVV